MSENTPLELVERKIRPDAAEHNVRGWERAGSLAGGVIMVGKGLRRGGFFGLIQIAIGGVALARGWTGHSSTKALLEKSRSELDSVRSKIERAGEELVKMKDSAVAATETATVTGDESLKTPKV